MWNYKTRWQIVSKHRYYIPIIYFFFKIKISRVKRSSHPEAPKELTIMFLPNHNWRQLFLLFIIIIYRGLSLRLLLSVLGSYTPSSGDFVATYWQNIENTSEVGWVDPISLFSQIPEPILTPSTVKYLFGWKVTKSTMYWISQDHPG